MEISEPYYEYCYGYRINLTNIFNGTEKNLFYTGGAIFLLESLLTEKKDGPPATAMWDLMMLNHAGPGSTMRERSPSEFQTILTQHGFKDVKVARTQEYCEYDVIYAKLA